MERTRRVARFLGDFAGGAGDLALKTVLQPPLRLTPMSDRKRRIDKRVTISDPADFARALSASSEADEPRRRCRPATWASGDQAGLDVLAALAANVATEEKAAEAQFISQSAAAPLSASMAAVTAADAFCIPS